MSAAPFSIICGTKKAVAAMQKITPRSPASFWKTKFRKTSITAPWRSPEATPGPAPSIASTCS